MGFIYIAQAPNGKCYVGQTKRHPEQRLQEHAKYATCRVIHHAIKKYGLENFDIDWIEVPDDELDAYEVKVIAKLECMVPNGYNLTSGGEATEYSAETRAKMSKVHTKRMKDPESRAKISATLKGHAVSEETRAKISVAVKGKRIGHKLSAETRAKIGASNKGKTRTVEHRMEMSARRLGRVFTVEEIMHALENHKTMKAAAASLGMTYQTLWKWKKILIQK